MGFMTVVAIGNDAWSGIEKNADEFVAGIREHGINGGYGQAKLGASIFGTSFGVGNFANYVQTHSSQHADVPQLCLAYQNMFTRFGYTAKVADLEDSDIDLLEKQVKVAKEQLAYTTKMIKEEREKRENEAALAELMKPVNFDVPTISDSELDVLLKNIKVAHDNNGLLTYLDISKTDPKNQSYIWDKKFTKPATGLTEIATYPTRHSCGHPSLFKPSLAEVLASIPDEARGTFDVMALDNENATVDPSGLGHHCSVTLYKKNG